MRTLTPTLARRLAIQRQRLAGPCPTPDAAGMLETIRDLGCLQIDPIAAVARTQLIVLWSRLGPYDPAALDHLQWQERQAFEYWAHAASLVLTEDFPIFHHWMHRYATGSSDWLQRTHGWAAENQPLHDYILDELQRNGPLLSRQLEDRSEQGWHSSGWTSGRNVSRMLEYLWTKGVITVAGRSGQQRLWDLLERWLPNWTPREELSEREVVRRATQRAIRALGVAMPKHIRFHFTRGSYPDLPKVLAELEAEGRIEKVAVGNWPGGWYIHTDDLPLLERLEAGEWDGRTTLLSPFDNLICDRGRTEQLWDFRFRIEIYVPPAKREFGYYVLPILHGDRLIGRVDPTMDRKQQRLTLNAIFAEPDAPQDADTARAIRHAIESLATFLGARDIHFTPRVPDGWRSVLT